MTTHTIPITGMTCGHCESSVRDALARTAGIQVLAVDKEPGHAQVEADATVTRRQLAELIEDIGFSVDAAWAAG